MGKFLKALCISHLFHLLLLFSGGFGNSFGAVFGQYRPIFGCKRELSLPLLPSSRDCRATAVCLRENLKTFDAH